MKDTQVKLRDFQEKWQIDYNNCKQIRKAIDMFLSLKAAGHKDPIKEIKKSRILIEPVDSKGRDYKVDGYNLEVDELFEDMEELLNE
jgi:hypothetical protein